MSEAINMVRAWRRSFWSPASAAGAGVPQTLRTGIVLTALLLFAYCAHTAWDVLQDLRTIHLVQYRQLADVLTVGDVLLCVVGYGLGKEIFRALTHRESA